MTVTGWSPDAAAAIIADLDDARATLEEARSRIRQRTTPTLSALPTSSAPAVQGVTALADDAEATCTQSIARIDMLRISVGFAGWSFDATDAIVRGAFGWVADTAATAVGHATRTALGYGLGAAVVVGGLLVAPLLALAVRNPHVVTALAAGTGAVDRLAGSLLQGLQTLLQQHGSSLVNDPRFLDALALAIDALDDVGAGFVGLPGSTLDDDEALGAAATAALLLGLLLQGQPPRLPGAAPVRIEAGPSGATAEQAPVGSYGTAFERIQSMESPVEIDRYTLPDGTVVWQVFAGGTETFDLDAAGTAYDMTSNIENATNVEGGPLVGSAAAVDLAMAEAGVQPGDVVQMFGYSQGGAAVAGAALSGRFRAHTVVTFGAPVGATAVPSGTTAVAVQNDSDVVAHLGGTHGDDRLVLEASPDLEAIETTHNGQSGPLAGIAAGGHYPDAYAETATSLDELDDDVVDAVWEEVDVSDVGPITSTGYAVRR